MQPPLLKKVKKILAPTGSFWVIIPFSDLSIWTEKAKNEGLFIQAQINIKGKIESSFNRSIISFGNNEVIFKSTEFVIRESSGNYSRAYIELTKDFHFNDLNA